MTWQNSLGRFGISRVQPSAPLPGRKRRKVDSFDISPPRMLGDLCGWGWPFRALLKISQRKDASQNFSDKKELICDWHQGGKPSHKQSLLGLGWASENNHASIRNNNGGFSCSWWPCHCSLKTYYNFSQSRLLVTINKHLIRITCLEDHNITTTHYIKQIKHNSSWWSYGNGGSMSPQLPMVVVPFRMWPPEVAVSSARHLLRQRLDENSGPIHAMFQGVGVGEEFSILQNVEIDGYISY